MTTELKKQIEQEAIDGTKARAENDFIGWNAGFEAGYQLAAEKYAELWEVEKLRNTQHPTTNDQ